MAISFRKNEEFQKMKKVVISSVAGCSLEWYDFAVYGFFTSIIGKLFFPSGDAFQQMIASFGVFASGLIARPIGAVLFGYIGDVVGRKKAVVISLYLMAVPTALMGFLPTYESIGVWAGVLLTIIRILQGLALGGGFTGMIVFLYEHAEPKKKCLYSSLAPFSLVLGFIMGALVSTLMSLIFSQEGLESIGWRIPFILSFVGTFIAEYVKRKVDDPKEFIDQQKIDQKDTKKEGLLCNLFSNHWKGLLLVIATDTLTAAGYFLIAVFFTTYLEVVIGLGHEQAFLIQTINLICFAIFLIFAGWLADKIGKRVQMLIACFSLMALVYPLFNVVCIGTFWSALIGELGIIFIFSMYYGPIPAAICSMLPVNVRLMGVSIGHNFSMAAFGSYISALAMYLIKWTDNAAIPAVLFIAAAAVTTIALLLWKENKEY